MTNTSKEQEDYFFAKGANGSLLYIKPEVDNPKLFVLWLIEQQMAKHKGSI